MTLRLGFNEWEREIPETNKLGDQCVLDGFRTFNLYSLFKDKSKNVVRKFRGF